MKKVKEYMKKAMIWLLSRIDLINTLKYAFVKIPIIIIACSFMFIGSITYGMKKVPASLLTREGFSIICFEFFVFLLVLHFFIDVYIRKKYWFLGNTFSHLKRLTKKDKEIVLPNHLPSGNYLVNEVDDIYYVYKRIGKINDNNEFEEE